MAVYLLIAFTIIITISFVYTNKKNVELERKLATLCIKHNGASKHLLSFTFSRNMAIEIIQALIVELEEEQKKGGSNERTDKKD